MDNSWFFSNSLSLSKLIYPWPILIAEPTHHCSLLIAIDPWWRVFINHLRSRPFSKPTMLKFLTTNPSLFSLFKPNPNLRLSLSSVLLKSQTLSSHFLSSIEDDWNWVARFAWSLGLGMMVVMVVGWVCCEFVLFLWPKFCV